MPYQALTEDQFNSAKSKGFNTDQIIEFEKQRKSQDRTQYEGGAMSPANVQAQADVAKAQQGVTPMAQAGQAVNAVAQPAGRMANSALLGIPGIISELSSGGKLANPMTNGLRMTRGGTNVFEGNDMTGGQKLAADIGGMALPVGGLLKGVFSPITKSFQESGKIKNELSGLEDVFTKPEGLPKSELVRKIDETSKDAVSKLRADKKLLDKSMFQESDRAAVDIQDKLPEYFKRNSTTYGRTVDKISDDLVKGNNEITRGEMSNILDDVLKESQDDLLASGKPMQEIEYLSKKYSLQPSKSVSSGILDESGKPFENIVESDPNEKLDFKQVVEDVKNVRKSLSSKAKMGERYSPEDVVAAKFAKRWGDYLETKVPDFKDLNQEYAPVIQTMKIAGKYFKPYSQGVDKLSGVSFLKNIAQDKLQSSEKKLLDMLEQGTSNFPGIGKQTGGLENIKNMQGKVSQNLDDTIKEYSAYKQKAQDLLAKEKELTDKRNKVIGVLTGTGLLTGTGAYIGRKIAGGR